MKNLYTVILFGAILYACSNDGQEKLNHTWLVPHEKMAEFLADAQIAEAELNVNKVFGDSNIQKSVDYYNYLFEKHQISKDDFVKSINYYLKHPDELEKIYEKVNEILSTQEGEKW